MTHEVVVVGAGIGGLTVAALLAARGVDVCVLERASQPGGVIATVKKLGYSFDPGMGIYSSWQKGDIHDRVFAELPIEPPEVRVDNPTYTVRLRDQTEIAVTANEAEFSDALRRSFPECGNQAVALYEDWALVRAQGCAGVHENEPLILPALENTSERFRAFVDGQLQLLVQSSIETCAFTVAATALTLARSENFSIRGGVAALANTLVESIKKSGGRIRLDKPVLRLAYDTSSQLRGVDLLSGETVNASQAMISNLTFWDTYGKLIGLTRTPAEVRPALSAKGTGAYLTFLAIEGAAISRLSSNRILALSEGHGEHSELFPLMFSAAPDWDPRAPTGKRAVTVVSLADVDEWFTYHESAEELESHDQEQLEKHWGSLHGAFPELGADVEVIETASPLDCYEATRRKLGMVAVPALLRNTFHHLAYKTLPDKLYLVGDTTSPIPTIAGITQNALSLANKITNKKLD